jgi:prepilin-type N-terminal cleavage/methylation domain-containing protein
MQQRPCTQGFSLIEIIVALAIALIVFIAVFQNALSIYLKTTASIEPDPKYFSYAYGEPYCELSKDFFKSDPLQHQVDFQEFFSSSTRVTSAHVIHGGEQPKLLVTTDSASTTEPDILVFDLDLVDGVAKLSNSIDIGPGIQDSKLLDHILYIANTSVNSHIKSFKADWNATGSVMFTELSNIRIGTLALSTSLPKKLSIFNGQLILGTEKSNTGGELFVMPMEQDGAVRTVTNNLEFGGQINQALQAYGQLHIANAADPELRVLNEDLSEYGTYDAPLTLGNGKSILYMNPYTVFGRTLGSGELSVLSGTSTALDIRRTDGTVDFLQSIEGSNANMFLAITANQDRELQFWSVETILHLAKLVLEKYINIPGRVTAYACDENRVYTFVFINNQATLIWFNI